MQCPKCHTDVIEGRRFCKICGTVLDASAPIQPATVSVPLRQIPAPAHAEIAPTLNCPKCGVAVNPGRSFCGRCGAVLIPLQQMNAAPPAFTTTRPVRPRVRKPVNWRKLILGVGIPAFLAAAEFAAWRFLPRTLLPPEKIGNILDQATSGNLPSFGGELTGHGVRIMSGGTVWEMPSGVVVTQGLNDGGMLSPDGENLAYGSSIYSLRTKQNITLENPSLQISQYGIRLMRYSPRGTLIAVGRSGTLYLLDSVTGKVVHILVDPTGPRTQNGACYILSATFSPDERTVAAGDANGNITLWNAKDGEQQGTLGAGNAKPCAEVQEAWRGNPSSAIGSVAFSPDGRLLASVDYFGVIRLWQISSRSVIHALPFHLGSGGVRFSPDGKILLTPGTYVESGQLHRAYLFVDVDSGRLLRTIDLPGYGTVGFSSEGNLLIASIMSGRIKVDSWSLPTRIRVPYTTPTPTAAASAEPGLLAAYEGQAVNLLEFLQTNLGSYRSGGTFPHSFQDLADVLTPRVGEFREGVHGYRYTYTPGPAAAQGNILSYAISAQPLVYQQTGSRSFLMDQTAQVHATEEQRQATTSDAVFRSLLDATFIATPAKDELKTDGAPSPEPDPRFKNPSPMPPPPPASRPSTAPQIGQWLTLAENKFQQGDYRGAIDNCEAVLRLDPGNVSATRLKAKVQETMRILGKN